MKTFHQQSTQYYIRSSQLFHTTSLRVPALIFVSKSDPIGAISSNLTVQDTWESMGIKVSFLLFDDLLKLYKNLSIYAIYLADLHENIRGLIACSSLLHLSQRIHWRTLYFSAEIKFNTG
jgi:hypothetical protein